MLLVGRQCAASLLGRRGVVAVATTSTASDVTTSKLTASDVTTSKLSAPSARPQPEQPNAANLVINGGNSAVWCSYHILRRGALCTPTSLAERRVPRTAVLICAEPLQVACEIRLEDHRLPHRLRARHRTWALVRRARLACHQLGAAVTVAVLNPCTTADEVTVAHCLHTPALILDQGGVWPGAAVVRR